MRWNEPVKIPDEINVELCDYHPVLRRILFVRGIRDKKEAETFLHPRLDNLSEPSKFFDMKKACKRIEKAIKANEKIFIHGDFDADGICATAILWEYLYKRRGADVLPYIPSRINEGYGMSEASINRILEEGGDLVISVDCGIRDGDLVDKYLVNSALSNSANEHLDHNTDDDKEQSNGSKDNNIAQNNIGTDKGTNKDTNKDNTIDHSRIDFIITDHHEIGEDLPSAVPVIHPGHPKGDYPFRDISGAAVAWKLVAALEKRRLKKEYGNTKDFQWKNVPGLDLVALSTVCDIMPLVDENRIFVKYGLEQMRNNPRVGLKTLMKQASINPKNLKSYHLGYVIGPRINAAGRIGDATDALRLLVTANKSKAQKLALLLGDLNNKRQDMTQNLLDEVRELVEKEGTGKHLYFAYGDDWPEGIIGLVAGKIQEEFHHPVILVSRKKEESRGSARSIKGFNIVDAIEKHEEFLVSFGGHELAAGFTVSTEKIEDFKNELQNLAEKQLKKSNFVKEIGADIKVSVDELDWKLWNLLKELGPFGYSNRKPVFWLEDAVIASYRVLSDGKHLKFVLKGENGGFLEAIFFNGGEWESKIQQGISIDLIGNLDVNTWNGEENLQFKIKDLRLN
jgi:single-stranded-DNA-specific exonuclease